VGVPISRVSHHAPVHRLGGRVQLLRPGNVGTVALIGVAAKDYQMTLTLVVGALLWNYLSWLYNEIAMSIAYERWEGTLEYTFMAPVSRSVHLLGVSLFSLINSIVTSVIVLLGLIAFT
jgi:ABC-2 type transport system permease protein